MCWNVIYGSDNQNGERKKGEDTAPRRDSAVESHEKKVDNNDRKYKGQWLTEDGEQLIMNWFVKMYSYNSITTAFFENT